MKKQGIALILVFALMTCFFCLSASAETYKDSSVNITTSGGKEIELRGHIEPTIISVTMPSYIPFDISRSLSTENKVVSPRIDVENNSAIAVSVVVDNTRVDLSEMPGVFFASEPNTGRDRIAIGFSVQTNAPESFQNAIWLAQGRQDVHLMTLGRDNASTMYIVGSIGQSVPENKAFSVSPTLVVRAA